MTDFKASDRDVNRAIRSWLHEDRHEDVSRVAGAVLDQVETIPQRRATWWPAWRTPTMNKFLTIGLGAAAVVVVALRRRSALRFVRLAASAALSADATHALPPSRLPSRPRSRRPRPVLPEGPYLIPDGQAADPEDTFPPLTVTIPAPDWYGRVDGGILFKNDKHEPPDGAGMIIFAEPGVHRVRRRRASGRQHVPDNARDHRG